MKRLCNIFLLFFLASGSLSAMDDPGIWDDRGNYLGPAYCGPLVYVPFYYPGLEDIPVTAENEDAPVATFDEVTIQENTPAPAITSVAPAQLTQENKKHWADFEDDDDEPSLPADWIPHASCASSSSSEIDSTRTRAVSTISASSAAVPKPLTFNEKPPRFRNNPGAHPVAANQMSTRVDGTMVARGGAELVANWREPALFDDRLALAARNGRDTRQQFMHLLSRKVYWLTRGCYERKIAKESEKLIYILDQNMSDFSMRPHDVKDLLRLTNECINHGVKRSSRKDSKQGFARVANQLLCLAIPSLSNSQQQKVQEICNQVERILERR